MTMVNHTNLLMDLRRDMNDKATSENLHKIKMELPRFALYDDLTMLHK